MLSVFTLLSDKSINQKALLNDSFETMRPFTERFVTVWSSAGRWRFYGKEVASACRNARFWKFRMCTDET
jgi:hypothetical protein